jgi:hypothetical protein
MGVGGDGTYTVSRKFCTATVSTPLADSTRMLRLAHARPPLPLEPDRSRVTESHSPIVLGAATATVGTTVLEGAATVTGVDTEAFGQLLVSHVVVLHFAFTTALEASVT